MSRIRGKDTAPELRVRSLLHRLGFRFRIHRRGLPGKPDIVLPGRRKIVFVHGCFWHRHEQCKRATMPSTRTEFWESKFAANVARDREHVRLLTEAGWDVAVVWECEVRNERELADRLTRFLTSPAGTSSGFQGA